MNTKLTFWGKLYNRTTRKDERVKGYCYYCGNPIFNLELSTSIDEHGECVYCRDAELRGAEKARRVIIKRHNEDMGEWCLKIAMRGEDRARMCFLFGKRTISGAVHQANRLEDE